MIPWGPLRCTHYNHQNRTGSRFTNGFSIAIQIRWKFRFTLTSNLKQFSLQNFVHGNTVCKFVAIWWPATELKQDEFSVEFELRAKKCGQKSETGPWSSKVFTLALCLRERCSMFPIITINKDQCSISPAFNSAPTNLDARLGKNRLVKQ